MKQYLRLFRWKRSRLLLLLCSFAILWFLFFDTHSLVTKLQLENQKKELIERTEEYRQKTAELLHLYSYFLFFINSEPGFPTEV
ncbi:MAG: hypothetical protein GVY02_06550 [Bacteroidetes bacterium]|jgi:hypothetical protein|nr:hypothetical protein [Bacteroidota bacterium]